MPSRQIKDFSKKRNRKNVLVARPGSGGVKGRAVGSKVSLSSSSAVSHVLVACSSGSPQRPTSGLDAGAAWLAADTPGDLKVFSRPKVSSADRSTAESDPKVSSQ